MVIRGREGWLKKETKKVDGNRSDGGDVAGNRWSRKSVTSRDKEEETKLGILVGEKYFFYFFFKKKFSLFY